MLNQSDAETSSGVIARIGVLTMDTSIPPQRQCSTCKESFPATLEHFRASKNGKYGLNSVCRPCVSASAKAYGQANRERISAYGKSYREQHSDYYKEYHQSHKDQFKGYRQTYRQSHKEQRSACGKEYYQSHKEQVLERHKEYYQSHKEQILERTGAYQRTSQVRSRRYSHVYYQRHKDQCANYTLMYCRTHPEWVRANNYRRRALKRNNGGSHTVQDIRKQYANQKGKCYYCKKKVGTAYHVDHVIPLSRGGSNGPENLVVACPTCNLRKNANIWRLL